jgi:hypothetical protein
MSAGQQNSTGYGPAPAAVVCSVALARQQHALDPEPPTARRLRHRDRHRLLGPRPRQDRRGRPDRREVRRLRPRRSWVKVGHHETQDALLVGFAGSPGRPEWLLVRLADGSEEANHSAVPGRGPGPPGRRRRRRSAAPLRQPERRAGTIAGGAAAGRSHRQRWQTPSLPVAGSGCSPIWQPTAPLPASERVGLAGPGSSATARRLACGRPAAERKLSRRSLISTEVV